MNDIKRQFIQAVRTPSPVDRFILQAAQRLSQSHAIRIKSAEFWLKLGEADQALRELESLSAVIWNDPSAVKIRVAAIGALRARNEITVEE